MWEADQLVKTRSDNINRYKRNFLRQAVCELRFPTLMELGGPRPPAAFVSALRKEYPHLELANEVTFGVGMGAGGAESNHTHIFRSSKLKWSVSLKQNALTVETNNYSEYADLKKRVLYVVEAAKAVIDSDFFTRVGLRYINVIECGSEDPTLGWVNPELVAPLSNDKFSGVSEYAGRLSLLAEDGGFLLQHGLQLVNQGKNKPLNPDYVVDIDAYRNEVNVEHVEMAIDIMHAQAFDIFDWSLGDKARSHLEQP